jgi:hypothetical protein
MMYETIMRFINKIRGRDDRLNSIIDSWRHELTPEDEKRKIEARTKAQREMINKMHIEMKSLIEEHETRRHI